MGLLVAAGGLLVGLAAASLGAGEPVAISASASFGDPRRVTVDGYDGDAMEPFVSRDGGILFFNNSNDPAVDTNLHWAVRVDALHFAYRGEIAGINTPALEGVPSMDREGRFFFVSTRSYEQTFSTIYRAVFDAGAVTGVGLVSGISREMPPWVNFDAEISADGEVLVYVDSRFRAQGGPETADLRLAERVSGEGFRRLPGSDETLRRVNTGALEYAPALAEDGRELYFTRLTSLEAADPKIYRAVRRSADRPFQEPRRIEAIEGFVEAPTLAPDGSLYYHRKEGERFVLYRVTRGAPELLPRRLRR